MRAAVEGVAASVEMHEEEGAGHWWDGDRAGGADCVDWPPAFELMAARTLPRPELTFDYRCPGAWYCRAYGPVRLDAAEDFERDLYISAAPMGDAGWALTTDNVRRMTIDGGALIDAGITTLLVDEQMFEVEAGPMVIGPTEGKRPGQHGPLDEAFYRPFCFVYDTSTPAYAEIAAHLTTYWSFIGNGQACAVPFDLINSADLDGYNRIYLGVPAEDLDATPDGITWGGDTITVGGESQSEAALVAVFPESEGLSAIFWATPGHEWLLPRANPFGSRRSLPDYLVFGTDGGRAAGFFTPDWRLSR
ncbi:MAG: hypothetical protein ACE366_30130 [Bradymonadia bacterium]